MPARTRAIPTIRRSPRTSSRARPCCNYPFGRDPEIGSELYFRVGPSIPIGDGAFLSRNLATGFTVQGGLRTLFYNNDYTRYRLPNDIGLTRQLQMYLCDNIEMEAAGHGAYGKVWIKRTATGYEVDLP